MYLLNTICYRNCTWTRNKVPASSFHEGMNKYQLIPICDPSVVQVSMEALGGSLRGGMSGLHPEWHIGLNLESDRHREEWHCGQLEQWSWVMQLKLGSLENWDNGVSFNKKNAEQRVVFWEAFVKDNACKEHRAMISNTGTPRWAASRLMQHAKGKHNGLKEVLEDVGPNTIPHWPNAGHRRGNQSYSFLWTFLGKSLATGDCVAKGGGSLQKGSQISDLSNQVNNGALYCGFTGTK